MGFVEDSFGKSDRFEGVDLVLNLCLKVELD